MAPVTLEELKTQSEKLSAGAISLKMALDEPDEDPPTGRERIPEAAATGFEAYNSRDELSRRIAVAA